MIASMRLAGIPVSPDLVLELADLVDEPTETVLERALETEVVILALTIEASSEPSRILPKDSRNFAACSSESTSGASA